MAYKDDTNAAIDTSAHREFTFGCFNHARKLSKQTIKLFAEVITLNDCNLALKSISFKSSAEVDRVIRAFQDEGIEESRLKIFSWKSGQEEHLRCYNEIDVALDPFPYGGATTTCEAIHMGIPVISLKGNSFVQNLSASILHYSDMKEYIANTKEEYIRISRKLRSEGKRGDEIRESMKEIVMRSRLGNPERLTRELEKIYEREAAI